MITFSQSLPFRLSSFLSLSLPYLSRYLPLSIPIIVFISSSSCLSHCLSLFIVIFFSMIFSCHYSSSFLFILFSYLKFHFLPIRFVSSEKLVVPKTFALANGRSWMPDLLSVSPSLRSINKISTFIIFSLSNFGAILSVLHLSSLRH